MANQERRMFSSLAEIGPPASVFRSLSIQPGTDASELPPLRTSASQRSIIPSRKSSHFYVNESFESLNYAPITNQIELERQKAHTFRTVKIQDSLRIGIFLLTGVLTACIGVLLEIAIEKLGHLKYHKFEQIAMRRFDGSLYQFAVFMAYRFVGVIVPVMIGAGMVTYIAPYAAGGGVAQCIGFLNGVRVPNVLSIKGLVVKSLSTICTVISGLAGGKEGPMMHMGAITGGSLPSALPWLEFKLENERRDFAAAGFGAGIAVVFGAPIGGLLLALEEGVSFLELSLMWKIYLCCVISYAAGGAVMSLIHTGKIEFNEDILSLGFISSDVTEYTFFEVIPFAVMAVIGGLIGALLIQIHKFVAVFRDRYTNKSKTRKMITAFVAGCVVLIFQMSAIWLMRSCSDCPIDKQTNKTTHTHHQLYCSEGKRSDMSLLFSKTQGDVLRLFFGPDTLQMSSLGLFALIYFILMCITMGLSISAGIFIPQIILGAAWGRLLGTFLNHQSNNAKWARPEKYAYLGAAAQLSGTVGKTFSILVIFVEASGSITLSFPLMVIVSITRLVCTFFVLPIYETQMHIMGLPFLPLKPPPLDCDIPTTRNMSKPPLVTLPPSPTVADVIQTISTNCHNGFPVVNIDNSQPLLIGLILRQQLLILLKYRAYKHPPPTTSKQMCECYETYMREARAHLSLNNIIADVDPYFYEEELDLTPYYNLFPPTITSDTPMIKTYELFRSLGMRHLVVINKHYEPVGMITRKDLAKFHTIEQYCSVKVKEMVVRS